MAMTNEAFISLNGKVAVEQPHERVEPLRKFAPVTIVSVLQTNGRPKLRFHTGLCRHGTPPRAVRSAYPAYQLLGYEL